MVHKVAAHGNMLLSLNLDRGQLERDAKETCRKLLPDWHELGENRIEVTEISGGITNVLWKLSPLEAQNLKPVVLRVFGKQTDKIIDRKREEMTLRYYNQAGFGAQVLATFENGRIEAFLPMRPLKPEEMVTRQMATRIARRLKHLHAVQMEGPAEPDLFPTIRKWLRQARELDFSDDKAKQEAHAQIDFDRFEREVDAVQNTADALRPEPCFGHNDLLSGNILVPNKVQDALLYHAVGAPECCKLIKQSAKECPGANHMAIMHRFLEIEGEAEGEVQLIDFEYSDFTYRSFDIANHFNEYAGFECDYSRFPDSSHIAHFLRQYLEEGTTQPVDEEAVNKMVAECYLMALASHQFWGTWALLQARFSPIHFDYVGYARLRWGEFFQKRDKFLARAHAFLKGQEQA